MPVVFCYKLAVLLEVTGFYPVDLSCPGYLVRMLKCGINDAEIVKYIFKQTLLIILNILNGLPYLISTLTAIT